MYFTSLFPSAIEGTVFGKRLSKNFIALLRLFLKIQNDQFAWKLWVKGPVLKIRWSEKVEKLKFWIACVILDLFPSFFEKCNKNSFLICLANIFSTLQVFEQFAVSEHRVGFVESRSVITIPIFTTNQPTFHLSTSFWTAISHINALIAYSSPSSITSIVSHRLNVYKTENFYQLLTSTVFFGFQS